MKSTKSYTDFYFSSIYLIISIFIYLFRFPAVIFKAIIFFLPNGIARGSKCVNLVSKASLPAVVKIFHIGFLILKAVALFFC